MFKFTVTHVIENPKGHAPGWNYSLVGSVPTSMMDLKPATQSDVMGGRARRDATGRIVTWKDRQWQSIDQIRQAAKENGVKLCDVAGCACRKLF